MSFNFLLMGAQAAGIGIDMYAKHKQERAARRGAEIDKKEIDLQMQQEQLASTEQSVLNVERLREALASQRAIFAARGQASGQGTPVSLTQNQLSTFNQDEQARQLSLSFRKYQGDAQKRLLNIGLSAQKVANKLDTVSKAFNLADFNQFSTGGGSKINKPSSRVNGGEFKRGSN